MKKLYRFLLSRRAEHKKELERRRNEAIELARKKRREAESRISNMIAQINGCGDRWFLQPLTPLDECLPDDKNGDQS
jgi:hypothetical protein